MISLPDVTEPPGISLPRSHVARRDAPASTRPAARTSLPYVGFLVGLTAAVVLMLATGVVGVPGPSLKTLIETVGLLTSLAVAYFCLSTFLLDRDRWALFTGLTFVLLAGTQAAVTLPLTLSGSNINASWYGPALTDLAAAAVAFVAVAMPGVLAPRLVRPRLLGVVLIAVLWTVLAAMAGWGALPGAGTAVRIGVQLLAALLLLAAGMGFWRRALRDPRPFFVWLAIALPVQGAAAVEYAARSWRPDEVSVGDIFNLLFSLVLAAGLGVLISQAFYRLRSREKDLHAVDALSLVPTIQDTRRLAEQIAAVVGPSVGARARVLLSDAELSDPFAAHLVQLDSRSETDVVVTYQEENGSGDATVGVALRAAGKRLGLLVASRRQSPAFSRDEVNRLRALAAVAATMIERSLLYDEVAAGAIVQERSRLAREIHDGLAQHLAFLKMRVAWMLRGASIDREHLEDIESVLETALVEARQAITTLRAAGSIESAAEAIVEYAQEFGQVSGLKVEIRAASDVPPLGPRPRVEVLRVVQEALNNVRKHAAANTVRVSIDAADGLLVIGVEDNGCGFDTRQGAPGHFGLEIMRERVESVGGTLEIRSRPGAGTHVMLRVPGERL